MAVTSPTWFGESWDWPMNYAHKHQETPVGEACSWCEQAIEAWASGVVMVHHTKEGVCRRLPQHLECFHRAVFGSVGHQRGRCECYGGTEGDPDGLTVREAAFATILAAYGSEYHEWSRWEI